MGPVRLRKCPHPATVSLHPAVYFFPVSHPHHEDEEDLVPNLIDHAVVLPRPDIDAVELLFRLHLLHPMRTRILFEAENVLDDLPSDVWIKLAEVPLSQDSVSEFPHEVAKRHGPLLMGLFQSGTGVFEVDSVHLLPGPALQEAEVIHRDDGG